MAERKTQSTDYTISNGLVQFTMLRQPAAHAITADFTFLHRVRFDAGTSRGSSASGTREGIEFSNFYFNLYECKEVQLISVANKSVSYHKGHEGSQRCLARAVSNALVFLWCPLWFKGLQYENTNKYRRQ